MSNIIKIKLPEYEHYIKNYKLIMQQQPCYWAQQNNFSQYFIWDSSYEFKYNLSCATE